MKATVLIQKVSEILSS